MSSIPGLAKTPEDLGSLRLLTSLPRWSKSHPRDRYAVRVRDIGRQPNELVQSFPLRFRDREAGDNALCVMGEADAVHAVSRL